MSIISLGSWSRMRTYMSDHQVSQTLSVPPRFAFFPATLPLMSFFQPQVPSFPCALVPTISSPPAALSVEFCRFSPNHSCQCINTQYSLLHLETTLWFHFHSSYCILFLLMLEQNTVVYTLILSHSHLTSPKGFSFKAISDCHIAKFKELP